MSVMCSPVGGWEAGIPPWSYASLSPWYHTIPPGNTSLPGSTSACRLTMLINGAAVCSGSGTSTRLSSENSGG